VTGRRLSYTVEGCGDLRTGGRCTVADTARVGGEEWRGGKVSQGASLKGQKQSDEGALGVGASAYQGVVTTGGLAGELKTRHQKKTYRTYAVSNQEDAYKNLIVGATCKGSRQSFATGKKGEGEDGGREEEGKRFETNKDAAQIRRA